MRTRIKMCGMTSAIDIAYAVTLGVDAIGFIFYEASKRCVSIKNVSDLLVSIPAFVDAVGVFVNPEASFVAEAIKKLPIQYLQFHGEETLDFCEQFGMPYIKAIPATSINAIVKAANYYTSASALLLDTPSTDSRGGTGKSFNWKMVPKTCAKPIILAGGLTVLNVTEAMNICSPYAVDVCSGVEKQAGVKDHHKMSQFVTRVRGII